MNREIKFRGKRVDNGEWVYGYLVVGECSYIITAKSFYSAVVSPSSVSGNHMSTFCNQVDPKTVGQFTGLKDKNGRKVYEGDIVKNNVGKTQVIEYSRFYHSDGWDKLNGIGFSTDLDIDGVEVIGNIHKNPDLLTVGK